RRRVRSAARSGGAGRPPGLWARGLWVGTASGRGTFRRAARWRSARTVRQDGRWWAGERSLRLEQSGQLTGDDSYYGAEQETKEAGRSSPKEDRHTRTTARRRPRSAGRPERGRASEGGDREAAGGDPGDQR